MVTMRAVNTCPRSLDLGLSLLAGLITGIGSVTTVAAWLPHEAIILLAAAQGAMLLARRRAPTAVLAGTTAVGVLMIVAGYPGGSATFGACCAAYAVAVYGSGDEGAELVVTLRHAAVVAVAAIAVGVASVAPGARGQSGTWGVLAVPAFVAASWVLGYAIRTRRAYIAELKARAARLEAEEGERAARAVVDERLRIARELHDVIGYSISLITVQAEAAARSGRPATGGRGRAQPSARAGGPRRTRSAAERVGTGDAARRGADGLVARGGARGVPDRARVADQRSQARRPRSQGRGHRCPQREFGAGVRARRRCRAFGSGREHGARHRRDVRARGRLRRDAAHRRPGGRRVRGRSAHPHARGGAMTITVLIADDQTLVRSGLRA